MTGEDFVDFLKHVTSVLMLDDNKFEISDGELVAVVTLEDEPTEIDE